jgi:hypothetical protein
MFPVHYGLNPAVTAGQPCNMLQQAKRSAITSTAYGTKSGYESR